MRFVYVIVKVTYDYHRFQKNLMAVREKPLARKLAKDFLESVMGIYDYKLDDEDCKRLDKAEIRHIWMQKFTVQEKEGYRKCHKPSHVK